jgi:hypothetical protein
MIEQVFIEEYGNGWMEDEMRDLRSEFENRGIPVTLFTAKRLQRRQLPLTARTLVSGTIPVVLAALKQIDVELPEPDDYPDCLQAFLNRRIWFSTVGAIQQWLHGGIDGLVFVKPKGRLKRFTGFVAGNPGDAIYFEGASASLPVYCSDVLQWRSEWRVFVLRGEIIGIRHYEGDSALLLDEKRVREAVTLWQKSGRARVGYAIDFGVLEDGTTALVELNDGFSIGSYGLDKRLYTDLTVARWCEMVGLK